MARIHSAAAVEIGKRVRKVREQRGISLEDLGHLAEVNWTTIGKIERGSSSPTVESIVRIATALEVDPGQLIADINSDHYGERQHQLTAIDLIAARTGKSPRP